MFYASFHMFYPISLCTACLKIIFWLQEQCLRRNPPPGNPKRTKSTRTRGGRRFLTSGGKTIGIFSKTSSRHQNRHQESFRSTPAFGDIEVNIGTRTIFPRWEEIFKKIKWEEFSKYTLHNDSDMKRLENEVLPNV
jgi:hypothetical protein